MGLVHHELCFGCGQANLFGLQMEVEPAEGGGVAGRFFVKQDHGGRPGLAHPGLMAVALEETMSLALEAEGVSADLESLELRIESAVPLGTFVHVSAGVAEDEGGALWVTADARLRGAEDRRVATARASFVRA